LQQAVAAANDLAAREPLERQLADRGTELAILLERRPRSSK
jgi:hypothetical protein